MGDDLVLGLIVIRVLVSPFSFLGCLLLQRPELNSYLLDQLDVMIMN